jgi:two-component system, NarL family, nitrate/nitrite response regulator NarL
MKVFLADDHLIYLESMSLLLGVIEGVELVGTAGNGEEVLRKIKDSEAEILVCDYIMPQMDGVELTFKLRELMPDLKVLMLTSREDVEGIKAAIQAGVKGFILKKISKNELKTALNAIHEGFSYFSQEILQILAQTTTDNTIVDVSEIKSLTPREIDIIKLIAQEMTGTTIAEKLNLSSHTVATHRKNIFHKLGVNSTYALIKYAIEHRLI